MNIYEDYLSYMSDNQDFIEKMLETNSSIYYVLSDVIKVTDYIYRYQCDNEEIEEEIEEIFEIGFGFIANVLSQLNVYYNNYFDKNMEVFNYYSELMLYFVYIEDYLEYLKSEEILTDDVEKLLNGMLDKIDNIIVNKKPFDKVFTSSLDATMDELKVVTPDYKPVYNVFRLIVEELQIEDEIAQEE